MPSLVLRERKQQWAAQQIVNVPQFQEETVDVLTLVPRERELLSKVCHNPGKRQWRR